MKTQKLTILILGILYLLTTPVQARQDIILTNVNEVAIDLPRIYFLLKRNPQAPPLMTNSGFQPHYAFLDTGASGLLISSKTVKQLRVHTEPEARYIDVGVGGEESFGITEPLQLGIASYQLNSPMNLAAYRSMGVGRFKIKKGSGLLGGGLDIIGMPAMMGRVVVLHAGATNQLGHFAANILPPGASAIPPVHITIPFRLYSYNNTQDERHVPPLPTLAPNPVLDRVTLQHRGRSSQATWLLDTGGTISLISKRQAQRLGLIGPNGKELVPAAFNLPIGGVGDMTMISGYQIDRLIVPTANGSKLIYINARIGVHDIIYIDPKTQKREVLDGVFGSNFLCASASMAGILPSGTSNTRIDFVVLDFTKQRMGFQFMK